MLKQISALLGLALAITTHGFAPVSIHAQEPATTVPNVYFLADDADDVRQVWHFDGTTGTSALITHSATDVMSFAPAHQTGDVVYLADATLFLQKEDADSAEMLLELDTADVSFDGYPVFSPDDSLLAYGDDGLWVREMASGVTTQHLVNDHVDYNCKACYVPIQFLADNTTILFQNWLPENIALGSFDLATGSVQSAEEESASFSHAFALADGRLILYTPSFFAGRPDLQIVDPADLATREPLLNLHDLSEKPIVVGSMMELAEGQVRMLGVAWDDSGSTTATAFYFDYDLTTGTASAVTFFPTLTSDPDYYTELGELVGDGTFVLEYRNATSEGFLHYGEPVLYNLVTGESITIPHE